MNDIVPDPRYRNKVGIAVRVGADGACSALRVHIFISRIVATVRAAFNCL